MSRISTTLSQLQTIMKGMILDRSMIISKEEKDSGPVKKPTSGKKNEAAVKLGALGGEKGGPARAEALTAEERHAIAEQGAEARWGKN